MAILRATFTAFVDQGVTGDSLPIILEWNGTTAVGHIVQLTVAGGAGTLIGVPPVDATLMVFIPPVTNTIAWSINGAGVGPLLPATGAVVQTAGTGAITLLSSGAAIPGFTVMSL